MFVQFKVGNKETAPGKDYLGIKDGMPIDFIEDNNWKPSAHTLSVFAVVKLPDSWKLLIVSALLETHEDTLYSKYRVRSKYISLTEIQDALGIADYEVDLRREGKVVAVADGTGLSKSIFKDSTTYSFPWVPDLNAVSSGSFTIGSGGQDYATWAGATADTANLTAWLLFTQETLVTETGASTITEALGGFTLTFDSDSPHLGKPTLGHLININHTASAFNMQQDGPGILEIKNIYIKRITQASANNSEIIVSTVTTAHTVKFHDLLINGQSLNDRGIVLNDDDITVEMFNVKIWDEDSVGLFTFRQTTSSLYENISIDSCVIGVSGNNKDMTCNNIVSTNNSIKDFSSVGIATGNNCVSSDATADDFTSSSAVALNIDRTKDFKSVSDVSSDFLVPVASSSISSGGKAPDISDNTAGIEGNPRPHKSAFSIGANEIAVTWFDTDWKNRIKITIANGKVSGTDPLYDFPVLITKDNLESTSFFSDVLSDGADIVFTADDGSTKLKREVVSINTSTPTLEAWVKIPGINPVVDGQFYIYFNNSSATETNDTDTWNSDYVMVQHMDDVTTSTIEDSTSNNNDGSKSSANNPIEASGKIGNAQDYSTDSITVVDSASFDGFDAAGFHVSAWVTADTLATNVFILEKLMSSVGFDLAAQLNGLAKAKVQIVGQSAQAKGTAGDVPTDGTFIHLAYFWDGSTARIYIDSVDGGSATNSSVTNIDNADDLHIGSFNGSDFWDGKIDEVRIWKNFVSQTSFESLIGTEFNNQDSPATFFSVGAIENVPVAGAGKLVNRRSRLTNLVGGLLA